MATEAIHGVRARCDDCAWFGPLHRRYGSAVADERRHVHRGQASETLTALLHLTGHGSPYPARTAHLGPVTLGTHRPSQ